MIRVANSNDIASINKLGSILHDNFTSAFHIETEINSESDIMRFKAVVKDTADMLFERYKCQLAYAVHGNTDNLHVHYVLNSVRYVDGYKLQIGPAELYGLKDMISRILSMFGFTEIRVITKAVE